MEDSNEERACEVESKLEKGMGVGAEPTTAPASNVSEVTKLSYRLQTWDRLEKMDQVVFPRPCQYRIPRFKGENEAVEKLSQLDEFKDAKVVKVNLDKAHERVRLEVIQNGKSLIAGTPGLKEAVFLLMRPPMEANKLANRMAASRLGIRHLGSALDFSSGIKADLVVLGSVAVDRKGHRIGKGEGFTDLEYALLTKLGIIEPDAPIVTVVHDLQVYESFPDELFKPWDVPVDVIVTPTQVIRVEKQLSRPKLSWSHLSNRRVNDIPIVKQIHEKDQLSGENVELKEVESDTEGKPSYYPPLRMNRRFFRRRRLSSAPPNGHPRRSSSRGSSAPPPRRRNPSRTFRQRGRRQTLPPSSFSGAAGDMIKDNVKNGSMRRFGPPLRKIRRPRYAIDFSVKLDGLTNGVRIRDLKAAIFERNVRPIDISWRAAKGVALLHFAKKRPNLVKDNVNGVEDVSMENVVNLLQGLSVKTIEGTPTPELKVEGIKPVPRKSLTSTSDKEGVAAESSATTEGEKITNLPKETTDVSGDAAKGETITAGPASEEKVSPDSKKPSEEKPKEQRVKAVAKPAEVKAGNSAGSPETKLSPSGGAIPKEKSASSSPKSDAEGASKKSSESPVKKVTLESPKKPATPTGAKKTETPTKKPETPTKKAVSTDSPKKSAGDASAKKSPDAASKTSAETSSPAGDGAIKPGKDEGKTTA